jgi:hypothetical protein
MLLYWLAHAYATTASHRLRDREPLSAKLIGRTMLREVPILLGAAVPLFVVIFFGASGATLTTAVNAGVWSSAIVIVAIESVSAARADLSGRELIVQVVVGALLGLLVLGLRSILH